MRELHHRISQKKCTSGTFPRLLPPTSKASDSLKHAGVGRAGRRSRRGWASRRSGRCQVSQRDGRITRTSSTGWIESTGVDRRGARGGGGGPLPFIVIREEFAKEKGIRTRTTVARWASFLQRWALRRHCAGGPLAGVLFFIRSKTNFAEPV